MKGGGTAPGPGEHVLRSTTVVTGVFVVSTTAAVLAAGPVRLVAVAVDLVLFAVGSLLFLAAFAVAVGRSRTEEVTLGRTFLLTGSPPSPLRRRFWVLLVIQVVVALVAASVRPYTSVAFAVLAPMSVLGAMAWYGARYADDAARRQVAAGADAAGGDAAAGPD